MNKASIIAKGKSIEIFCVLICILFATTALGGIALDSGIDPMLWRWNEFSQKPESRQLVMWLKQQARAKLTGMARSERLTIVTPPYFGKLGIFITLKRGGKVRGCYGAFSHARADAEGLLLDYLYGALTGDPRYEPLETNELDKTDIIVSVTSQPHPVDDPDSVDVLRYGVAVTCGDATTYVYVPAEMRDTRYIQKLMNGKECQVSAFRAVTIR